MITSSPNVPLGVLDQRYMALHGLGLGLASHRLLLTSLKSVHLCIPQTQMFQLENDNRAVSHQRQRLYRRKLLSSFFITAQCKIVIARESAHNRHAFTAGFAFFFFSFSGQNVICLSML